MMKLMQHMLNVAVRNQSTKYTGKELLNLMKKLLTVTSWFYR